MLMTLPNRVSALFADPIQTVFRDFDREFALSRNGHGSYAGKFAPLTMWEDGVAVYVEMDVPGIAPADLNVYVENGKLFIRAERKAGERSSEFVHEERYFGAFERTIALSEWVDPTTIEATLQNGVLHLKLDKKPESRRQKISVNLADGEAKRISTSG